MTSEQLASLEHDFAVTTSATHDEEPSEGIINWNNFVEDSQGEIPPTSPQASVFDGQEIPF